MIARALTDAEAALLAALDAGAGGSSAAEAIRALGLPTRRNEAWKWSDLRAALTPDLVLPAVTGQAIDSADAVVQLAAAFGRFDAVQVRDGERLVIEDRIGEPGALDVRARRIKLGAGASLMRILIQDSGGVALDRVEVELSEGAQFRQVTLAFGAKLARLETHVTIAGEGARADLASVALVGAGRHADLTSRVEHRAAHGVVDQVAKSAARAGGRAVFQGKFFVERGAQKTDARMRHDALLLDGEGEIDAKPELEIYADDVQCAHGNTVGALDPAALFYLRQRGLPEARAKAILLEAFIAETFEGVGEAERDALLARARAWLEAEA